MTVLKYHIQKLMHVAIQYPVITAKGIKDVQYKEKRGGVKEKEERHIIENIQGSKGTR